MTNTMSHTLYWQNAEKTVLVCEIHHVQSWQDLITIRKTVYQWLSTVQHRVHTVVTCHQDVALPTHSRSLAYIRELARKHPNQACVILVAFPTLVRLLLGAIKPILGYDCVYVDTLSAALDLVQPTNAHALHC